MGNCNWWAPQWLVRRLPTIRFEGSGERTLEATQARGGAAR